MEYEGIAIIPLIVGISEVFKKLGFNIKYIPIINLTLGIAFGVAFSGMDIRGSILTGIFMGLSASGLYSGVKNITEGIRE